MDAQPPDPEPIEIPIEDALDLHAFAPREISGVVESYLEAAAARGFGEVRLIHGKGIGMQRERIRTLLARHPLVERFADAPAERGHWGATLVWLRSGDTGDRPSVAEPRDSRESAPRPSDPRRSDREPAGPIDDPGGFC